MSSGSPVRTGILTQNSSVDYLDPVASIADLSPYSAPAGETSGAALFATASASPATSSLVTGPIAATGSSVLVSAGNFGINLEFDAAAAGAGSAFASAIQQAASILVGDLHVNHAITLNIQIQYNENGLSGTGAEGGPSTGHFYAYTDVRQALAANAPGDANFNALPGSSVTGTDGSSVQSYSTLVVYSAQEKALGLVSGTDGALDGTADFGSGIAASNLVGVALHEITHALGRISEGPTNPDIFDLFRFTAPGTVLVTGGTTAPAAYFSVDGGTTSLAAYGTSSDPSDLLNTGAIQDPFAESYDTSTPQTLTALDLQQMDVLGFSAACFAEGTRLATPDGCLPVEALRPGMPVLTLSGAVRPVRWVGHRRVDLSRHPDPEQACPILIRAGALGQGVPARDLRVSPEHAMFLDGGLVPAWLLVNGRSILRETSCSYVVWYHIELDTHDLVLAEGAATESYLDTGNRGLFENAAEPLVLHPCFTGGQAERVARSCMPFLDDPAVVEPIWRRLSDWAAAAGFGAAAAPAVTHDPCLVLWMGGRSFRPSVAGSGRDVFVLPTVSAPVRLVSRATAPNTLQPWVADRRRLGVSVSRLTIRRGDAVRVVAADDPALRDGWFAVEHDDAGPRRWTDGNAALPLEAGEPVVVEIACRPMHAYALQAESAGKVRAAA